MDDNELQRLNEILRPVAPPRVLDGVYSDDQHSRLVEVIKRNGPWPTITAHHFDTVEELMATSNGGMPENLDLTLDDIATAHFRGIFGKDSISFFPSSRTATTTAGSSSSCVTTGARSTPGPR